MAVTLVCAQIQGLLSEVDGLLNFTGVEMSLRDIIERVDAGTRVLKRLCAFQTLIQILDRQGVIACCTRQHPQDIVGLSSGGDIAAILRELELLLGQ